MRAAPGGAGTQCAALTGALRRTGTLLQNGLHPHRLAGMVYSPVTRTWALSDDLAVNYIGSFCAAAPRDTTTK